MGRKAVHRHTPSPLGASEAYSPEFIPHQLPNLGQASQATSPGLLFLIGTMGLSSKLLRGSNGLLPAKHVASTDQLANKCWVFLQTV